MKNLMQKLKVIGLSAALTFGAAGLSKAQDFSEYEKDLKNVQLVKQESSDIGKLYIYHALKYSEADKGYYQITIDKLIEQQGKTEVYYVLDRVAEYMYIKDPAGVKTRIFETGCFDYTYTQVTIDNKSYDDPTKPEDKRVIHQAELEMNKYIQDIDYIKAQNN